MKTIVLLVKNGIGFGHIRRAILIAEAIRKEGRLRPVIVSQASSLSLFRDTAVEVVNFPLLHRVSSAVAEDSYTAVLDRLLHRLDPAVVIEDTYPDPRYLSLPALAHRPRLLVMRRLDGTSFDLLRSQGRFGAYDAILIAQSPEDFGREGHSGQSVAAVQGSGRFTFVGNLCYCPSPAEIGQMRQRYAPAGERLVVVNGGAGGDQMPDGYGDRLFHACAHVAAQLREESSSVRFVFVTGPYYAGRALQVTPNVTVRRFEPQLAALLAAAHVAVIKPGNNALSEALLGQAQLVLVPDVSFMEGLDEHAARIAEQYGGATASTDPVVLASQIRASLARPLRTTRPAPNHGGLATVIRAIDALAQPSRIGIPLRRLMLILIPGAGQSPVALRGSLPRALRGALIIDETSEADMTAVAQIDTEASKPPRSRAVLLGSDAPRHPPQMIADQGVQLLISRSRTAPGWIERWQRLAPSVPTPVVIGSWSIKAVADGEQLFYRALARLFDTADPACAVLDLASLPSTSAIEDYLTRISGWLESQPVELVPPESLTERYTRHSLEL
ncbi:hypothetical protein [Streptomyces sp. CBMA123]|uniref:hypothetical protein n=1 Tax=Streptomyces sp. CBMA123 TaxID=1896313 RepID=UPI0016620A3B|nr:hypothetical protein [Streptomyces sp. CBMA123]MBD0688374.1 hypothetical protein [Streptomyces sp. CBMA123]